METFLKIILFLSSIVLIASILLQQGNSQGLSGAIGGGAEQLFGKKRGRALDKFLKKITLIFAILFVLSSFTIVTWEPKIKGLIEGTANSTGSAVSEGATEAPVTE